MSKLAFAFEDLAEPELPFVHRLVEPGTIAIDAGSHYGDYTVALARAVRPSGEVWAVDPSPGFMSVCRANVALNGLDNVRFLENALSDCEGLAVLIEDPDPSRAHVSNGGTGAGIKLETLDRLYSTHGMGLPVSFIKLDIEGSEMPALMGGESLIKQWRPTILVEMQDSAQLRSGTSTRSLWTYLESLDYDLTVMDSSGRLHPVSHPQTAVANYIARPRPVSG